MHTPQMIFGCTYLIGFSCLVVFCTYTVYGRAFGEEVDLVTRCARSRQEPVDTGHNTTCMHTSIQTQTDSTFAHGPCTRMYIFTYGSLIHRSVGRHARREDGVPRCRGVHRPPEPSRQETGASPRVDGARRPAPALLAYRSRPSCMKLRAPP